MVTVAVERGCGERQEGGIYMECGLSPFGRPVEDFIIDAPLRVIDPAGIGLTARGVTMIQRGDTWDVWDWIGSEHYPNVLDFVMEVKRFGASRRLSSTVDFGKLTPGSKMVLVHARGWMEEAEGYWEWYAKHKLDRWCPKNIAAHVAPTYHSMCASLWWSDVEEGSKLLDEGGLPEERCLREMPSFSYKAYRRPEWVNKPGYIPAAFMALPITDLVVVRNPCDEAQEAKAVERASASALNVERVDA